MTKRAWAWKVKGMEGQWRSWDEAWQFCVNRGILPQNIYKGMV